MAGDDVVIPTLNLVREESALARRRAQDAPGLQGESLLSLYEHHAACTLVFASNETLFVPASGELELDRPASHYVNHYVRLEVMTSCAVVHATVIRVVLGKFGLTVHYSFDAFHVLEAVDEHLSFHAMIEFDEPATTISFAAIHHLLLARGDLARGHGSWLNQCQGLELCICYLRSCICLRANSYR